MPILKPLGALLNARDYADRVNLIKKIKTPSGWRFASVVPEANGRLKDRSALTASSKSIPKAPTTSSGASAAGAVAAIAPPSPETRPSTPISGT
ncbi:MAG TPA: hypothetical protein VFC39_21405 [Acidobacteriaceae bacterium]|nr:hypothetical protein [Acidobacteriaceae bacterium]